MAALIYSDAVRFLRTAARVQDPILARSALLYFKANGITSREAFRIALAGNPDFTAHEWLDLLARADVTLL